MIEGDEAEMVMATDAPVGETLLIREYLLEEANSSTQLLSSMSNLQSKEEVVASTPQKISPPTTADNAPHGHTQTGVTLQSHLPYSRPVTPQSFSRPHTASKAAAQSRRELR